MNDLSILEYFWVSMQKQKGSRVYGRNLRSCFFLALLREQTGCGGGGGGGGNVNVESKSAFPNEGRRGGVWRRRRKRKRKRLFLWLFDFSFTGYEMGDWTCFMRLYYYYQL